MKKGGAKRSSAKRGGAAKKSSSRKSAKKATRRRSNTPVARVKRVASGVVEQAQTAVSQGVDAIKEFGENMIDRVTG